MSEIKSMFIVNKDLLMQIFSYGIDYGQLLMEEERDNEEWADAFNCYLSDLKTSMPSQSIPRRQPHSDNWRNAKRESLYKFMSIVGGRK